MPAATDVPYLIAAVRTRLNIVDATQLPDATILEWLNAAQEAMVQTGAEWRGLEQQWRTPYTITDDGIVLPQNLAKVMGVWQEDPNQTDPTLKLVELTNVTRRQWVSRVNAPDVSRTFPRPSLTGLWHYFWADRLYVVGNISGTTPLQLLVDYYGPPAELVAGAPGASGTTNYFTRFYPRTLLWGAFAEGYEHLEQLDLAEYAEAKFQAKLERARTYEKGLQAGGGPHQRGL